MSGAWTHCFFASSAELEAADPQPLPDLPRASQAGAQTGVPARVQPAGQASGSSSPGEQAPWSPAGVSLGHRGQRL